MQEREVEIVNKLGLHARAAAKLVNTASSFDSKILVRREGQEVNAKSIMGIMMLAARQGSYIEIQIDGPDEDAAMDALTELIADRFGEGA